MPSLHKTKSVREKRTKEAQTRNEAYNVLSVPEKIKLLDKILGVGKGAKKQRSKLSSLSVKFVVPKEETVAEVQEAASEKKVYNKKAAKKEGAAKSEKKIKK